MRAQKFYQTGSLDDLRIEEVPQPTPGQGEVLVQVKAAAVNPSDIKNVQGKMHETTVPRIPGRDFAGIIVQDRARFWVNRFDQSLWDVSTFAAKRLQIIAQGFSPGLCVARTRPESGGRGAFLGCSCVIPPHAQHRVPLSGHLLLST